MTNVFGLGATSWNSWVFQFWILIDSARLESHTTGERRTGMLPSTVVGRVFSESLRFFFEVTFPLSESVARQVFLGNELGPERII